MDLWECTLLEDGTYALNDSASVAITGTRTAGYTGNIVDGKIEGTIPQYIKDESDGSFIEVTSIQWLFYQKTELATSPKIPDTITNMYNTFNGCKKLITVGEMPDNVTNMQGAFNGCTNLREVKNLPEKLENLSYTFQNCTSLEMAPKISNSVINMQGTFLGCTSLETAPEIPNSVTNMRNTFNGCTNLQGEITINANLTGAIVDVENNIKDYQGTLWNACKAEGITLKVVGTCPVLEEIVKNANNSNITL